MSILDNLTALGTLGVVGFVGYEFVHSKGSLSNALNSLTSPPSNGSNGQSSGASNLGNNIGTAIGQGAVGVVTGTANSVWLGGHPLCDFVTAWRQAGAPNASFLGFNVPLSGGGNPSDWAAFSRWMQISYQFDPGPTPPSGCW